MNQVHSVRRSVVRHGLLLSAAVVALTAYAFGQTSPPGTLPPKPMAGSAHPSFAVAVIRPHDPASSRQGFSTAGDRFTIRNESVSSLISFAYSVHARQIVDAPDWVFHDRYDVEGKPDAEGEPSLRQQQEMIQKLLADRFALRFHRDKRELPVYAIKLTKSGAKMKNAAEPNAQPDQEGNGHGAEQTITYTSASMSDFIMGEQFFVDRPLIDETGLTGRYDFSLHYTWDEARSTDPNAPPGLFTAVQEQLGLKFEPKRALTDVLVIDHAERPSEN